MFQRTVRSVVPAIAVAVALALTAVPAHAADRELAGPQALFERAWQWLASLWGAETAGETEKAGWTIDPDGRTAPATVQEPACTQVEAGICIDPNG